MSFGNKVPKKGIRIESALRAFLNLAPQKNHIQWDKAGFSLVELLVTLAIISILVSVALPVYNRYQSRTLRAMATTSLLQCAMAAEKEANIHFSYMGVDPDANGISDLKNCHEKAPETGTPAYQISVDQLSGTSFRFIATPSVDGPVEGTGFLGIDQTGSRFWDKNNDGDTEDTDELSWKE